MVDYELSCEIFFCFGFFIILGEVYIEIGLSEIGMIDYKCILFFDLVMVIVSFCKDEVNYECKYFVFYFDSVMVLKFIVDCFGM